MLHSVILSHGSLRRTHIYYAIPRACLSGICLLGMIIVVATKLVQNAVRFLIATVCSDGNDRVPRVELAVVVLGTLLRNAEAHQIIEIVDIGCPSLMPGEADLVTLKTSVAQCVDSIFCISIALEDCNGDGRSIGWHVPAPF